MSWPGAGAQPHDPEVRGYRDLIAHAAARIADGSDVIAQSMGGVVAIGLALAQPQKVRRLVLVATSGGLDVERHGAENWRDEYHQEFPAAAEWVTSDQVDYTDQLHRVTVPTCLIWSDADPVSPLAIGHALHRALPSSVLYVIAGGTHILAREAPDEITAIVKEHLR